MTRYIDKAAVVAEIERRLEEYRTYPDYQIDSNYMELCDILSFLDKLEVKEVDLQSEIDSVWDNTSDNFLEDGWKEFEDIAKHFFELGLKAKEENEKKYIGYVGGTSTTTTK